MLIIVHVWHDYSMFKLIFWRRCELYKKEYDKGGDFEIGALYSDFMFVNIKPYKSKKCITY